MTTTMKRPEEVPGRAPAAYRCPACGQAFRGRAAPGGLLALHRNAEGDSCPGGGRPGVPVDEAPGLTTTVAAFLTAADRDALEYLAEAWGLGGTAPGQQGGRSEALRRALAAAADWPPRKSGRWAELAAGCNMQARQAARLAEARRQAAALPPTPDEGRHWGRRLRKCGGAAPRAEAVSRFMVRLWPVDEARAEAVAGAWRLEGFSAACRFALRRCAEQAGFTPPGGEWP